MATANDQDDRLKVLNRTLADIERSFGKGSIMKLGEQLQIDGIEVISTGSISLDAALGVGGVPKGRVVEVYGYCFRHEPSTDPFRMQAFRQHDYVFLGTPEGARAHRDRWIERGLDVLSGLGLTVTSVVANDPFFGRPGRMLAANQRSEELKYEIVAPVFVEGRQTAISSSNCHLDHFSRPFDIDTADGQTAHTACFGFGVDRITLALLDHHGTDPAGWPADVRAALWP